MSTRPDPTDTEQFRRWAAGWLARTGAAVHHTSAATKVGAPDQSRRLGAILTVALDCLGENLDDPLARHTAAAMARAQHAGALADRWAAGRQREPVTACPTCGALPGRPCITRTGRRSPSRHAARYRTGDQPARTG